jgi:hypothetical protein
MRIVNRLATALLALALIAAGVVAIIESVAAAAGAAPALLPLRDWYDWLTTTRPDSRAVLLVSIAAILLGLLILVSQLRRWRPAVLDLAVDERATWRVPRRTVERLTVAAAERVTGVSNARAQISGTQAGWRIAIAGIGRADTRDAVHAAVRQELDRLTPAGSVPIRVNLRAPARTV